MMIEADKPSTELLAEVRRTLLVHHANAGGLCVGCYDFACVISIFPCSQARWAMKVAAPCGGRPVVTALDTPILAVFSEPHERINPAEPPNSKRLPLCHNGRAEPRD